MSAPVMPTLDQALDLARSQIGTLESPRGSNRTKYGAWYGWQGVSWCQIFISWIFGMLNALPFVGGKAAATYMAAKWFQQTKQWSREPAPGRLAFYDFPDDVFRIQHVEMVEKVLPGARIQTIGGNTSGGDAGSQANGDGVYRRVRSTKYVVGYGCPPYRAETKRTPIAKGAPAKTVRAKLLLVDGVFGAATARRTQAVLKIPVTGKLDAATIKALQKWAKVTPDGKLGPVSRKAFQKRLGVKADGHWGKTTIKAWQRVLNRA